MMRFAIAWLVFALATVSALILDVWGFWPHAPWSVVASFGFLAFAVLSYLKIATLETQLEARPLIGVITADTDDNNRIIEMMEPDPATRRLVHTHDAFFKLLAIRPTAYVRNCMVKVTDLAQNGETCAGFVPTTLRWFGRDGEGSEHKSFAGKDFAILLCRQAAHPEWQLQAPVREVAGARVWYEPGKYEIELVVSAENALRDEVVRGVLSVGPELNDVTLQRRPALPV